MINNTLKIHDKIMCNIKDLKINKRHQYDCIENLKDKKTITKSQAVIKNKKNNK